MLDDLPDDLVERWKRGHKVRALDYLERQPDLRKNLAVYTRLVAEELRQMHQSGMALDTEQLLKDYPECRDTILSFDPVFETLVARPADAFETQLEHTKALDASVTTSRSGLPEIPGFEILSELGRGGMGVVYRARQISANRLVALKVVRSDVLENVDSTTRANAVERFRTEVKAAASLQHDNIIAVYEVGEVPAKNHSHPPLRYYAMRFIQGMSLIDLIRNGPLENRRAATYMVQIARALQTAHDQGILHRDMKPHNVMVEQATDRPWVADFGLAKFIHSDNSITYAGQIMGTPSYMSPEQAQDASLVTPAADQYSLGATLYHLLTGHPPFAAPSVQETLRQILEKPPVRLRESNPAVDRDLETICMKAIEKEPSKRYASCQEFGADLQRYLDGIPIVARPIRNAERIWRWCSRNRVLAGMIAAVTLLSLSTLGAILVGYRNTAAALAVSESRLNQALAVVDDLFTRVSEDELLDEPGMQGLRKELLEKALEHYENFLSQRNQSSGASDTRILDEVAKSNFRYGMIQKLLGKLDSAQDALYEARSIQDKLVKQSPQRIDRLEALTDTLNAIGTLASQREDFPAALDAFERSHGHRVELAAQMPAVLKYQRLAANTLMNIGLTKISLGRAEEGLTDLHRAQDQRLTLLEAFPESENLNKDLARGWYSIGKDSLERNQTEKANGYFRQSVDAFQKAITMNPRSLSNRFDCSLALQWVGESYALIEQRQAAAKAFEESEALARKLADSNPDVVQYQLHFAAVSMSMGANEASLGQWDRSERSWNQSLGVIRKYQRLAPKDELLLNHLVSSLCALGDLADRRGDIQTATELRAESISGLEELAKLHPEDSWFAEMLQKNRVWLDANKR
jgi:serine/threonine-protein kinase